MCSTPPWLGNQALLAPAAEQFSGGHWPAAEVGFNVQVEDGQLQELAGAASERDEPR
jgi:hypothetical protein